MADSFDITELYGEGTRFFELPSGEKVVVDSANRIQTSVVMSLDAIIDHDGEGFLDLVSYMVTDGPALSDFTYRATGVTPDGNIILEVEGCVSDVLAMEDGDEDANEKED